MKRKLLKDNPNEVVRILFNKTGLKYDAIVEQKHKAHPLYPSYQSIAYILSYYGVDNCLIGTDKEELKNLPKPLVINYDGLFLPILDVTKTEIHILNEMNGVDISPIAMLDHLWSKTALVLDIDHISPVESPRIGLIRYYFNIGMKYITLISCILIGGYLLLQNVLDYKWINYAFLISGIAGIVVGTLFQIQEFDRGNKFVNKICSSRQQHTKKDCSSILDSKEAHFLGLFSWADFGLLYFIYLTILPFFSTLFVAQTTAMAFSLFAALYIPYSLFYQRWIVHKWCPLCLMIQSILFINLVVSIFGISLGYFKIEKVWGIQSIAILNIGIVTTAIFTTVKIFFKQYREQRLGSKYFNALKHDYSIKSCILESEKEISTTEIEKIVLQPNGTGIITIVFNPVCTPCMRKMRQFLEIYKRKKDTRLELIFLLDKKDQISQRLANMILSNILPILTILRVSLPNTPNIFLQACISTNWDS